MFSSSLEYLQALRKGEYLRFLEWSSFVAKKYAKAGEPLGGDALLDCCIFEWLAAGLTDEDIEKVAILYGVYEQDPSPIQSGNYAYSIMTISSALFMCMAINAYPLDEIDDPKIKMTEQQVQQFIKGAIAKIGGEELSAKIGAMRDTFMRRVASVDTAIIKAVSKSINELVGLVAIWEKYVDALNLKQAEEEEASHYNTRLGIAKRFLASLKEQTKLNDDVRYEMALYLTSIRAQHPNAWEEEEFLQKISPFTIVDKAEKTLTLLVWSFFSLVRSGNGGAAPEERRTLNLT